MQNVSTHSRPKAAGRRKNTKYESRASFNTQPPEGGWPQKVVWFSARDGFNTQPPEGGWHEEMRENPFNAGFNTQPPEGGWAGVRLRLLEHEVSTHSRPKAADPKANV